MTRRASTRRGFTLVEALATMTVIGILGSISSTLIYTGVRGYRDAVAQAQLHEEMSIALEHMTRVLRTMPCDPTLLNPIPSISAVGASTITWDSDSRLWLSGTNLQYQEDGGADQVLLTGVTSFGVQCYDEAGTALATNLNAAASQQVRRVQLSITASSYGITETLRTRVFLRCGMEGGMP